MTLSLPSPTQRRSSVAVVPTTLSAATKLSSRGEYNNSNSSNNNHDSDEKSGGGKGHTHRHSTGRYGRGLGGLVAAICLALWAIDPSPTLPENHIVAFDGSESYDGDGSNHYHNLTKGATAKSLGRRIVEASYKTSGFEDFVTDLCPRPTSEKKKQKSLPSRFKDDFWVGCLNKARDAGNKPGTYYHQNWPWWFRTLLRDLAGGMQTPEKKQKTPVLVGRWHYLQFKGVGGKSSDAAGSGGGRGGVAGDGETLGPRLQMCVYEKGGTKSWKRLHCDHNHDYFPNGPPKKRPDFNQCFSLQPKYDEELEVLAKQNPGNATLAASAAASNSDRAVFLRDPLDRFLSGFLDKCVKRSGDPVDHCEPVAIFQANNTSTTSRSPIETMLWDQRRTFEAYVDTFPLTWNMHFFPQSFYCGGLYRTIADYDFVGSMGETFYTDLEKLQTRYPGLRPGMERVFSLSKKLKESSSWIGKPNQGVETNAAKQVLDYYTPHTVRRVLEYYAIDYVTLGLPIPDWAEKMLLSEVQP